MKADYDRIADAWSRARRHLPARDRRLIDAFLARLPAGAGVLDLGCGNGRPIGLLLADRGHPVHGVDRSARLLAEARRILPHATFAQGEIEDHRIDGTWAGVVLWDVLFHLPREAQEPVLRRIAAALEPGGVLVMTSGGSTGDEGPFTDRMFDVEFFYDAFPRGELVERCQRLGYRVDARELLNVPDGGRDKGRLGLLLSKPVRARV